MPVGKVVVLVGMGERTTYQAVSQLALRLFKHGAAEHIISVKIPPDWVSMHLDTVLTFCDRNLVAIFETVFNTIQPISFYPGNKEGTADVVIESKGWLDFFPLYSSAADFYSWQRPLHLLQ